MVYSGLFILITLMSSFFLVLKTIGIVFVVIYGLLWVMVITMAMLDDWDAFDEKERVKCTDSLRIYKAYVKLKKLIVVSVIVLLTVFIVPSKQDVLAYWSLRQVDTYNTNNETSTLNVEDALTVIDGAIAKVQETLK